MKAVPVAGGDSGVGTSRSDGPENRRLLAAEVVVTVGIAVGLSALRSILSFANSALATGALSSRTSTLNASRAPGHPWIDLGYQLVFIVGLLLPAALVAVHLLRSGESLSSIGLRRDRLWRDIAVGLGAAAAVGGIGLAAYLIAHRLGAAVTIVPTSLPPVWWRIPVLIGSAVANATLEEVVLVGYLVRRCEQLGVPRAGAVAVSAGVRGAYHLYQGVGAMLGNALMGATFAGYFARSRRVVPQLVAHAVIDTVAFVGFIVLAGRVSWLPV